MINFSLEKRPDYQTGEDKLTLVKKEDGKPDDEWCTIDDLNQLFDSCVARWGSNWNLEKVKVAITESQID